MVSKPQKRVVTMRSFLLCVFLSGMFSGLYCQRNCTALEYQEALLKATPQLSEKILIVERFIQQHIATSERTGTSSGSAADGLTVIRIPVVVHVLYNAANENISDDQIKSQITALNDDFRKLSEETNLPGKFKDLAADTYIEFSLAAIDPKGRATTGIVRKKTSIIMFGMDDRIKYSGKGGDDAWDASRYLNIWVGNTAGAIIGYASVIGGSKDKDGVVIRHDAFGTTGRVRAPYNYGRTAVHEIGHWLGLYHIWGDKFCGDDHVADTPPQQTASRGCPSGVVLSLCEGNGEGKMYMNFMDLTDDACMNMFTYGQRDRMRALFAEGGPRNSLLLSDALTGTPREEAPLPEVVNPGALKVFPNPVQHFFTLELPDESAIGKSLLVYNLHGQPVMKQVISRRTAVIPAGKLITGMYFIKVEGQAGFVKFFKQ